MWTPKNNNKNTFAPPPAPGYVQGSAAPVPYNQIPVAVPQAPQYGNPAVPYGNPPAQPAATVNAPVPPAPANPQYVQQPPQYPPQQAQQAQRQYAPKQAQPQPSMAAPTSYGNEPTAPAASADGDFISGKITKLSSKNKAMDFTDRLVKANEDDYANVHGCGGKNHAPNSGISVNLCDYSKGTGSASVTVSYMLDVRQIDRLRNAVAAADTGTLGLAQQLKGIKDFATANGMVIGWLQSGHQPTYQELTGLQQILGNGLTAQDPEGKNDAPVWTYESQKNNPYRTTRQNGKEYAPVSALTVQYNPSRRYAWSIKVSNFMAPLIRQENGASSHNAKEAIDKKEVIFPLTTEAFACALADVAHYIDLWEFRMYPTINAKCTERERRMEAKRQQNTK